ncbi:MAG TPA: LON peptidase substrate-binding domain-containing protein [Acidisarcina sp.]|nr:LON peptidase substrate-binding domain-containing protein [Acidisarcina sp.]
MRIPLFPLDVVLFPGAPLPLHIFENRYREMVAECLDGNGIFGVVRAQRGGLAVIGCTAHILRILERYSDGRMDILCEGIDRFEIETLDNSRTFLQAEVDLLPDFGETASRLNREECLGLHYEALELAGVEAIYAALNPADSISFQLAWSLPADLDFKQELLCLRSDADRTLRLLEFYKTFLPKLRRGAQASLASSRNGHVM